jgi:hypothetical protein
MQDNKHRYVVTLDCYLYAESDDQVKKDAVKLASIIEKMDVDYDELDFSDVAVIGIAEQPFANLVSREIKF